MSRCIYCNSEGPFNKEHVFPYFLGGGGEGWTLIDTVCEDCNTIFSALERALSRHSVESIPRTFYGPTERHSKRKKHKVPLYSEDIYCFFNNDRLVYEAGLELGFQTYIRPQIIEVSIPEIGITASDYSEIDELFNRIKYFAEKEFFLITKTPSKKGELFESIELGLDSENVVIRNTINSKKPKGAWFRIFPKDFDIKSRILTTRIYLDDDNKLIIKAIDISQAIKFLSSLLKMVYSKQEISQEVKNTPKQVVEGGNYEIGIRTSVKLELVSRAIAKIGLNFATKLYGKEFICLPEFSEVKQFALGTIHNSFEEAGLHVKPIESDKNPFQKIKLSADKHYMLMSYSDKEGLIFWLNPYGGNGGYLAKLGNVRPPLDRQSIQLAIVDYSERKIELLSKDMF